MAESRPTVVYVHGGGGSLGSLDSHDSTCRWLCRRADVRVLSVDYRLAPEHPFPAAMDDVFEVVDAALTKGEIRGVDHRRVAVVGDSLGGNLVTVACLRRRNEGLSQPEIQVLIVPVVNLTEPRSRSYHEFERGLFLGSAQISWYEKQYMGDRADPADPYLSPLQAEDLSGVAPAYIAVAGFDPLRDEGEAYARKLAEHGVPVSCHRHGGLEHPFANSTGIWAGARSAMDEIVGVLRMALAVQGCRRERG
ncbi:alpha/beta hydrolase [Corynebacterium urogenitale]